MEPFLLYLTGIVQLYLNIVIIIFLVFFRNYIDK